jgi:hypothetical protein
MENEKVVFVVHENGTATLSVGSEASGTRIVQEVGLSTGLPEACKIFNDMMKKRHLTYRLQSGHAEMLKEILGS